MYLTDSPEAGLAQRRIRFASVPFNERGSYRLVSGRKIVGKALADGSVVSLGGNNFGAAGSIVTCVCAPASTCTTVSVAVAVTV